jgi:hypothetical protein
LSSKYPRQKLRVASSVASRQVFELRAREAMPNAERSDPATTRRNRALLGVLLPNQLALTWFLQGEAMSDYLVIGGWGGRQKIPVQILSETPDGFWIKPQERAMLPGRGFIKKGRRVHVPRTVIKLDEGQRLAASTPRKSVFMFARALLSKAVNLLRHLQPA